MLPADGAFIISDSSTSRIIPVKETATANKKKSKKKNRPGLNDRLRYMEKTSGAPKTPNNEKPKKKRKRYKKKKEN